MKEIVINILLTSVILLAPSLFYLKSREVEEPENMLDDFVVVLWLVSLVNIPLCLVILVWL